MGKTYKADVRYGTSFLSVSNKEKAAHGEMLSDKMTGEVYIVRPTDGKVISFAQKSQTVYDAVREFNLQFQSSSGYTYPDVAGAYLLGSRFTKEQFKHVNQQTDILCKNFEGLLDTLEVSTKTNGFFVKPVTRHGDKNTCGLLSGMFSNDELSNFSANPKTFSEWLKDNALYTGDEYPTWSALEGWKTSDAIVVYNLKIYGIINGASDIVEYRNQYGAIKVNEFTCVRFASDAFTGITDISRVEVQIQKFLFPKLQYERFCNEDTTSSTGLSVSVSRIMENDYKVVFQYDDLFYFIDGPGQVPVPTDTLSLNVCVDVDFVNHAISNIQNASGSKAVQVQVDEPSSWPVDTVWAEEIRDVLGGDLVTDTGAKTKLPELEQELYHSGDAVVTFTDDPYNQENLFIQTN